MDDIDKIIDELAYERGLSLLQKEMCDYYTDFKMYNYQYDLLESIYENKRSLIINSRQIGITTFLYGLRNSYINMGLTVGSFLNTNFNREVIDVNGKTFLLNNILTFNFNTLDILIIDEFSYRFQLDNTRFLDNIYNANCKIIIASNSDRKDSFLHKMVLNELYDYNTTSLPIDIVQLTDNISKPNFIMGDIEYNIEYLCKFV